MSALQFGMRVLPGVARAGGALLRASGALARSPFGQGIAANYVSNRLGGFGHGYGGRTDLPMEPDMRRGARGRYSRGYRTLGGRRRGSRGISASHVRITLRTLKTIKKLYSKLPKAHTRRAAPSYRRR